MFPPNLNVPHVFPSLDSFRNHEKYDVHFNPCEFLFHAYNNSAADPVKPDIVTRFSQDFVWQQRYCEDGHADLLDSSVICSYKKEMASYKKDENRKIDTAQGPKDRRVRLSSEIAQKFFGLQDFLGFDRASKTLDWLLSNSVTAIKELVEEKNHDSSDRSNLKFLEAFINEGGSDENVNGGKKKSVVAECVDGKKTKTKRKHEGQSFRVVNNVVSRHRSRAAARARARERTREKNLMKSGRCCSTEIEPESDYKDLRSECLMDPETTWLQSQDSSSLYNSLYQNLEYYFDDQQVIMQLGDLNRSKKPRH